MPARGRDGEGDISTGSPINCPFPSEYSIHDPTLIQYREDPPRLVSHCENGAGYFQQEKEGERSRALRKRRRPRWGSGIPPAKPR